MKKTVTWGVVLAVALAAWPAGARAQAAVGVRAGVRASQLDSGQDTGGLTSLVLGGYFGVGLTDRLALQIEGVYGTRGATGLGLGTDALDETAAPVDLHMHYLEVPLLLRTGFPGERLLPSFFVGPYAAFLLNCDIRPETGDARDCDSPGQAQRFTPRATDYGMLLGAALDVAVGQGTVFVDARYTLGLTSIEAGDNAMDARHHGFAVSGGFAFPLGG